MSCYVRLPETIQVEEAFGEAFGSCHIGTVAAVGEGVAAAQTQPLAQVLVQLRICGQSGLLPAERVEEGDGAAGQRLKRRQKIINLNQTQRNK